MLLLFMCCPSLAREMMFAGSPLGTPVKAHIFTKHSGSRGMQDVNAKQALKRYVISSALLMMQLSLMQIRLV